MELFCARQRRRLTRGLKRKHVAFLKRLRKAKKECPAFEKPAVVKTHLRNMIVLPEMVGSIVGIYNGKTFVEVEIKVRDSFIFITKLQFIKDKRIADLGTLLALASTSVIEQVPVGSKLKTFVCTPFYKCCV